MIHKKEKDGIVEITLDRPEKKNALSKALMEKLCKMIESVEEGIILLRGNGDLFCAGLDLKEIQDPQMPACVAKTFKTLYLCPRITIAAVHGAAIAGGAGLFSACDFSVAEEGVKIGFPEVNLGIVPALITPLLIRRIGLASAKELLLSGQIIDGKKAKEIGLINYLAPPGEAYKEAFALAKKLLRAAPQALSKTKSMLEEMYPGDFAKEMQKALVYHEKLFESREAHERIKAFFQDA